MEDGDAYSLECASDGGLNYAAVQPFAISSGGGYQGDASYNPTVVFNDTPGFTYNLTANARI